MTSRLSALLLLPLLALPAAGADFVDVFREPSKAFAITAAGEIYSFTPQRALTKIVTLSDSAGRPYRWKRRIRAFARWKGEWFAADGSQNGIICFGPEGAFRREIATPFRTAGLTVAGERLWALNMLAENSTEQLWHTSNGKSFVRADSISPERTFDSPLENLLVMAGSTAGELYIASMIGPPRAQRAWPPKRAHTFNLAYSRAEIRTRFEDIIGVVSDISPYSQPVRDLVAGDRGDLIVLRNREDVRSGSGKMEAFIARRADRYDSAGRHVATATFPTTVRWIISFTASDVVGMTSSGAVLTGKWNGPIVGQVLKP